MSRILKATAITPERVRRWLSRDCWNEGAPDYLLAQRQCFHLDARWGLLRLGAEPMETPEETLQRVLDKAIWGEPICVKAICTLAVRFPHLYKEWGEIMRQLHGED